MKSAKTLRAAADYIREHGWKRKDYGVHGGPRCLAGALMSATGIDDIQELQAAHDFGTPLNAALHSVCGDEWMLTAFNDRYCKNANDAIAVLEIAADLAS